MSLLPWTLKTSDQALSPYISVSKHYYTVLYVKSQLKERDLLYILRDIVSSGKGDVHKAGRVRRKDERLAEVFVRPCGYAKGTGKTILRGGWAFSLFKIRRSR